MKTSYVLPWLIVLGLGCAGSSFQPQFKAELAPKPEVLVRPMLTPEARDERPVAVGVTHAPTKLCAWELRTGRMLWEHPVEAKSAPLVVGDAVVMQEAEGVVVRDLASGDVRVVADEDGHLVGADGKAGAVVISVAYDTANPRGAVVFVSGRSVAWKEKLALPVGVPALSNDHVVVPWATQRLSVLAAHNGKELARFHFKSTVIGHAIVDRDSLYIGQMGLLPVTEALLAHPGDKTSPYAPRKRELPGQPALLRDGYLPVPEPDNAHHRLALSFRVAKTPEGPATENGMVWLRFFRLLFALDAKEDAVRWVRTFDRDLVGLAIVPGGVLVADDAGIVRFFDNQGQEQTSRKLDRQLSVVTLRPGNYVPTADSTVPPPTAAGAAATPSAAQTAANPKTKTEKTGAAANAADEKLRIDLFAAASLVDDRLGAGRAYAVEHLARFKSPEITTSLIALCGQRRSPEPVRLEACAALAERDVGESDVIETLRRHASFLEDTEAPPVGALAQAAAKMQLRKAGPLLVSHVEDPNTPPRDLAASFEALERLGQQGAVSSIARFVRVHHAEPPGSELSAALGAALHALGALKARSERATLEQVAGDAFATPAIREAARAAMVAMDTTAAPKPEAAATAQAEEVEEEVETDPRPYSLGAEAVRAALTPLRAELARCVAQDPSKPVSGRASMVVDKSGQIEGVFIAPSSLAACAEPILRRAKFPETRLGRQRIAHVFKGPNAARTDKSAKTARAPKPNKGGGASASAPAGAKAAPKPKAAATPAKAAAKPSPTAAAAR